MSLPIWLHQQKKLTGMKLRSFLFILFLSQGFIMYGQQPLNFDFERLSVEGKSRPWGWSLFSYSPDASSALDSLEKRSGVNSFLLTTADSAQFSMAYWMEPWFLRGKKLQLTGYVKTKDFRGGIEIAIESYGNLGVFTTLDTAKVILKNLQEKQGWQKFELLTQVDKSAASTYVILTTNGIGKIWFDDLELKANGKIITDLPVANRFSQKEFLLLKKHSYPLKSVVASRSDDPLTYADLNIFRKINVQAKLIALGESSHGTSEFFSIKHRLLEYGVRELNVRLFAIEANQVACRKLNNYVTNGAGDLKKLMSRSLFGVWNTEEVYALIDWIRQYNIEHRADMVTFGGFDMQDPVEPIDSLISFLRSHSPADTNNIKELLAPYRAAWKKQSYPTGPDSIRLKWKASAENVWEYVEKNKLIWSQQAKIVAEKTEVDWAVQSAKIILQNATHRYLIGNDLNNVYRDSCMAENLDWIMKNQHPQTRTMLWAHDSHISRSDTSESSLNYFGGESMGSFLSKKYKNEYKAFGISTYDGTYSGTVNFTNHKLQTTNLFPSPEGSFDEALHRIAKTLKSNALILDLAPLLKSTMAKAFLEPRPARFIGYASEDYTYAGRYSIPKQFDAIIFIDRTKASKRL